jgi:hypothetical protein
LNIIGRGETFSAHGCPVSGKRNIEAEILYETTLKANRRTAEYRISNVEGWFRFAQSFLKWTEYIPYPKLIYIENHPVDQPSFRSLIRNFLKKPLTLLHCGIKYQCIYDKISAATSIDRPNNHTFSMIFLRLRSRL